MTLVIFDCDGVLVESEIILITAELEFLKRHEVNIDRTEYMRKYLGMAPREWKEQLGQSVAEVRGHDVEPNFFSQLDDFTMARLKDQLVAVKGARSGIELLPNERCVASSSSPAGLAWKLDHTGLDDLFSGNVFSTQLVERGKPEPDLFLHAANAMGYNPAQCIVVEDSVNGVLAAKRAGMLAIGFTAASHCIGEHGNSLRDAGADQVAGSYPELVEMVTEHTNFSGA